MKKGFFLVEILVSLSIFTLIAVSTTTALLALIDANVRAQGLKSVMDNLNVAIENMSRTIRLGTDYKCNDGWGTPEYTTVSDCNPLGTGRIGLSFTSQEGKSVYYYLKTENNRGTIYRMMDSVEMAMTAPEANITGLQFFLFNADTNTGQPRVFIAINGNAGLVTFAQTLFAIQTTVSQRKPNF